MLAGPQMWISRPGSCSGGKNPSPWMWSMCRWVSRMSSRRTLAGRSAASRRIPVPASRISTVPAGPSTSHADGVAAVASGLGAGSGERAARAPETHFHAFFDQKIATAPRKRFDWPTRGIAVISMCRRTWSNPWIHRLPCAGWRCDSATVSGSVLGRQRPAFLVGRPEGRRPLCRAQLPGLLEAPAEDRLRGLVVEEQRALRDRR